MTHSTDAVVVGHRPGPETKRLLADLRELSAPPVAVLYSDNTGNRKNLSQAWNDLAVRGKSEFIAFLNSDVVLPPLWNSDLVACLSAHADVGAALPAPIGRHPEILKKRYPAAVALPPTRVELAAVSAWARAAFGDRTMDFSLKERAAFFAVMVRRSDFRELRGFDERLRFYGQDHDFQDRLRARGKRVVRVLSCPVFHWGSKATGDAQRMGDIDLNTEYEFFGPVLAAIRARRIPPWEALPDAERAKVRSDSRYRIPRRAAAR